VSSPRPHLFGTDGIRATFGEPPLDESTVRRLGAALASELRELRARPRAVLGGDTRDSTPTLGRWLADELTAGGVAVTWLGVVPTPGVASATRALGADCGVAVSASHNPHPDNGIKLIDGDGFKWSTTAELRLEERLRGSGAEPHPGAADLEVDVEATVRYLDHLAATLPSGQPLAGLRIAVDAGHGAASPFAGPLLERLGAEVTVICAEPDGRNVNAGCGSTHPGRVAALTVEGGAHLGLAFDGDADRVVVADERGEVRDGDAVLFLWGRELKHAGRLPGDRLVATTMSNLGLEVALRREGIGVVRCDVGDRNVVATMLREKIDLGGEQSGHVVNLRLSHQGDGLLTALQIAGLTRRRERPLSELLAGFERFPQLLRNVRVSRKPELDSLPRVVAVREAVAARLDGEGRLVLRYSGTEPLARIMIEGPDAAQNEAMADELAAVLTEELS